MHPFYCKRSGHWPLVARRVPGLLLIPERLVSEPQPSRPLGSRPEPWHPAPPALPPQAGGSPGPVWGAGSHPWALDAPLGERAGLGPRGTVSLFFPPREPRGQACQPAAGRGECESGSRHVGEQRNGMATGLA